MTPAAISERAATASAVRAQVPPRSSGPCRPQRHPGQWVPLLRRQDDVLGHHDVEAIAGADFERGLDVEVAPCHLAAQLPQLAAQLGSQDLLRVLAVGRAVRLRLRQLRPPQKTPTAAARSRRCASSCSGPNVLTHPLRCWQLRALPLLGPHLGGRVVLCLLVANHIG